SLSDDKALRRWAASATAPVEPGLARVLAAWRDPPAMRADADTSTDGATARIAAAQPVGPGARFGSLVLEAELGRGGMGVVYRAADTELGRTVAVQLMRADHGDSRGRERFLREARAVAGLRHDHVVTVHAVGHTPHGTPYLVMEFIDGATLAEWSRTRPTPAAAVGAIAQAADGLAAAHAA